MKRIWETKIIQNEISEKIHIPDNILTPVNFRFQKGDQIQYEKVFCEVLAVSFDIVNDTELSGGTVLLHPLELR